MPHTPRENDIRGWGVVNPTGQLFRFVSFVRAMQSCVQGTARVGVEKTRFLLGLGWLGRKSPLLGLLPALPSGVFA